MTDLTPKDLRALLDEATEGPWSAERDLPYNRMPRVHSDTDHSLICECGNVGTTQDQWEANARLIALAPDLARRVLAAEKIVSIVRQKAMQATKREHDADERALLLTRDSLLFERDCEITEARAAIAAYEKGEG